MKSAFQQRAEIELLHLIEMRRSRRSTPKRPPWKVEAVAYHDSEEAELRERESFRFSVEALAAIGAVFESETQNWMARFESVREFEKRRQEVTPDPQTEQRARRLLEDRLPPNNLDFESEEYEKAIWRFQEAQAAVNITGALTFDERGQWEERFLERLRPEDRRRLHNPPQCAALDLERVVPGPAIRHDGVRITHAELYRDGLVVHWHHSARFPRSPGRELTSWERLQASRPNASTMRLDLTDDLGSSYHWWPGPSHDAAFRKDGFVLWHSATFTPRVPEEATHLLANREGNTFDIPITS